MMRGLSTRVLGVVLVTALGFVGVCGAQKEKQKEVPAAPITDSPSPKTEAH